jgi:signal transduction histidine kinase
MTEKEVHRISAIAQQTLGFVREGSTPARLNVAEILDDVTQLYSNKLQNRHIQIRKEYIAQAEVQGFPGELRQLFSNLIINAADAMANGGTLYLRISPAHQPSNGHKDGIRVTIADNGSGIPPSVVANIFEPFFTTKKDLGTGLGLWLSQGIVEKHGGSIRVRSCVDPHRSGTVFSVFLPSAFHEAPNAKVAITA